jgi:hypothetical protein
MPIFYIARSWGMSMNLRQKGILGITFLVSAMIAYFLQDLIHSIIFEPLSYLLYVFHLMYLSVAQIILWFLLVVIVVLTALGSLSGKFRPARSVEVDPDPNYGPVERLARYITRSADGVYYKWLVANRLGKLTRSMLVQRSGRDDLPDGRLDAPDWNPPAEVSLYLESGLRKTFADFPRRRWFWGSRETPFDMDVEDVIAYLESKMEDHHD